ncbi:amino acid/amide ABC transporter substrate-binding protein, HAAT family [Marinobacter daqiaonensis]|uniref:Amino acid/amide ABC transporter substrate-binding protein, HAAT family n=1 Tax=Marinobacter daqiaonensis TaxID=650891 RepID=A0A1I6IBM6_9GAMM|nr:ABC transporter substrate-binding protein [Marinobacter daqiaonensis]SFR64152.1 amino acid/amide ABC transporter substrate-binding protein, HAAT family [Marinobacter daqiaonensis]
MNTTQQRSIWQKTLLGTATSVALASAGMMGMVASANAQDTFKVGFVTFLSGGASGPFGVPAAQGADIVVKAINEGTLPAPYNSKGVNGLQLETVVIDEAGGPTKQVEEYRNLVQRQNVDAVIGYISSGDCLAVGPVAEEMKMFTIAFDCGTPRLFQEIENPEYLFRTGLDAVADNVGAAHYLAETRPEAKRIAGIQQNYAWGQDSWEDFTLSIEQLMPEAEIVNNQTPQIFQGSYGTEISALQTRRPDIIHSSMWGGDMESFVAQANARGLLGQATALLTTGESGLHRFDGQAPNGTILGGRGPFGGFMPENDLSTWFTKAYEAEHGTPPSYPASKAAQAILALKFAADNSGAEGVPTPEQLAAALKGAKFESVSGTVDMALAGGHQAMQPMLYGEYHFVDGKAELRNIRSYPGECVSAPDGQNPQEWIKAGFPGAKCD